MSPRVLNRNRHAIPPEAVYVGRPSRWGNPFTFRPGVSRASVIERFRAYLLDNPVLMADLDELRGKDLVCWCAPKQCHADVLLELANSPAHQNDRGKGKEDVPMANHSPC